MDYESCFERVWRAGVLKKAADNQVKGRLWIYLKEFLTDRLFYLTVNNYKSPKMVSKVGIPQGSVLSPTLCNLYTSDCMKNIQGMHVEFADDASIWKSGQNLNDTINCINRDLSVVQKWCCKWNMSVAPEKTQAMIFSDLHDSESYVNKIMYDSREVEVVDQKKLLGITVDNKLAFDSHIDSKTAAGFKALSSLDMFISQYSGCSQSTYMKLFKALVLPVMDYGVAALATSTDKCIKQFQSVQRSAMLKATGCMPSTSTDTLEVLSNTVPIGIHLKLRQAQELVRIAQKTENDPLKDDFDTWTVKRIPASHKPSAFSILMSRFIEYKGDFELENIEKEFTYDRKILGLSRTKEKTNFEEFNKRKDDQVEAMQAILNDCQEHGVLLFTDGSSLGNPGPTGAGAAVYLQGYRSNPVLLKKSVSTYSNNYSGEIVGIEIALDFIVNLEYIRNKKIHIFTDCQAAIYSAFSKDIPKSKIETVLKIKEILLKLEEKGNSIDVHWIPGHHNIEGNELADRAAKEAATENDLSADSDGTTEKIDCLEVLRMMKQKVYGKWNQQYVNSEKVSHLHEIYQTAGNRNCTGEHQRQSFCIINQLLSGHSKLNAHWSKVSENVENICNHCRLPETVDHYIFHCEKYTQERKTLEFSSEEILRRQGINCSNLTLSVLIGEIEGINSEGRRELIETFSKFLQNTKRLC